MTQSDSLPEKEGREGLTKEQAVALFDSGF